MASWNEQTEADFREIERRHDEPPDEPFARPDDETEDEDDSGE